VRLAGQLAHRITDASAVTLHDRVFVVGGFVDGAVSDRVWALDFAPSGAPTLTEVGRLPAPVADLGAAVIGDTAYLVGGENSGVLDSVTTLTVR
jgi:hypothetical protein